ncbi:uncharacterized protein LOC117227472 [Megalopta genalis]|uniref:uncharacterized protein LOC117227472 n=1 Tax=Megalopta genalis TaxID=115081 RepID=UPI003FD66D6C
MERHRGIEPNISGPTALTLLCLIVGRASIECARSDVKSKEEFLEDCCLDDVDRTNNRRCGAFEDSNGTWAIPYDTIGNESATSCCRVCVPSDSTFSTVSTVSTVSKEFETRVRPEERKGRGKEEERFVEARRARSNPRTSRSCFEFCVSASGDHGDRNGTIPLPEEGSDGANASVRSRRCDSVFSSLNFWGANIVIFANAVYMVPYVVVVLIYAIVPGLAARAYGKVVLCYNVTQIVLNLILIGVGSCVLCHVPFPPKLYAFVGLALMFLTISSTFWLFMICVDITLAITRFHRASPIRSQDRRSKEKTKFLWYAGWTWGASLLPTALACVAHFSRLLPESSPIRPNFENVEHGPNLPVLLYVLTFPVLTCLANTVLFCYTSYRMYAIQRSTKLASANTAAKENKTRKRYFLYLNLYLLMDAPWITSALAAAFTDLWLLRFSRVIQPILMLVSILPPQTLSLVRDRICARKSRVRDPKPEPESNAVAVAVAIEESV